MARIRREWPLPPLKGAVDMYPPHQAVLVHQALAESQGLAIPVHRFAAPPATLKVAPSAQPGTRSTSGKCAALSAVTVNLTVSRNG